MEKIKGWVRNNWTDPVWSKVFAGIILGALGAVGVVALSLFKQIPIDDLYRRSLTTYIQLNYFSIILTVLFLLSLLIPAVFMDIIHFQLKHLKFPKRTVSERLDLQKFLEGQWFLTYTHKTPERNGSEPVTLVNGNQYYIRGRLVFVLTGIRFDEKENEIEWTKTNYQNNRNHSRETLQIMDENIINGSDDLGFSINYVRISK